MDAEVKNNQVVCATGADLSKLNPELTTGKALELIGESLDKLDREFTELGNATTLNVANKREALETGSDEAINLESDNDFANGLINGGQDRVRELNETVGKIANNPNTDKTSKMNEEIKGMCGKADELEAVFKQTKEEIIKLFK